MSFSMLVVDPFGWRKMEVTLRARLFLVNDEAARANAEASAT